MEVLTLTDRERGIEALRQGDLDGAARWLRGAVGADGEDAEAHAFLGIACSQRGEHEEAVQAVLPISLVLNQMASLVITWLYFVGPQARYGQTVGKMLLGIRLVGPDGGVPGMGRAAVRELGLKFVIPVGLFLLGPFGVAGLILLLPADCLWMLHDARQQTWHDRIAGTRVERA